MPGYQAPTLESLKIAALELPAKYKEKNNQERADQISLLKNLASQTELNEEKNAHDIMLGAWIFTREIIQSSYNQYYLSYVRSAKNSQLFTLIDQALLLDDESNKNKKEKNVLKDNDPAKFIYLAAFLQYLEKHPYLMPHSMFIEVMRVTKQAKEPLIKKIRNLCARLPTVKSLRENFGTLPNRYETIRKTDTYLSTHLLHFIFGRSSKRMEAVKFIEALHKRCAALPDVTIPTDDARTEIKESDKPRDYFIRMAAAIKVMREIEQEYSVRSPENSDLYVELQRITHLKRTSDLNFELKEADLAELDVLVCTDIISKEKLIFWEKNKIAKASLDKIKADILALRIELQQTKTDVFINDPRFNKFVNDFFNCIAKSIAQTGVLFVILEIANFIATNSMSFNTLLAVASPQNALIIMGGIWTLQQLRSSISIMLTNLAVPVVTPVVKAPLKALTSHSFFQLGNTSSALSEEDYKLLQALYHSPDEVYSLKEKRELSALFNLDEPTPDALMAKLSG